MMIEKMKYDDDDYDDDDDDDYVCWKLTATDSDC